MTMQSAGGYMCRCHNVMANKKALKGVDIPDICHERHEYVRVNFFWPVKIFTDLTRKIGNLLCILP